MVEVNEYGVRVDIAVVLTKGTARDPSLTLAEKLFLDFVGGWQRNGQRCYASAAYIAELLGVSEAHIKEIRAGLVKEGRLQWRMDGDRRYLFVPLQPVLTQSEIPTTPVGNSYPPQSEIPTTPVGNSYSGGEEIPTHINNTISRSIKKRESTPPPPRGSEEWFIYQAERELEEPTGEAKWERDNRWMLAGRRPMRKFPQLWFTLAELADALEQVMAALPEGQDIRPVFKLAQSEALTKAATGTAKGVPAYKYVVGYCLQQYQETLRKSQLLTQKRA